MQTIKKLIADKLVEGICALGAPQAPEASELVGMLEYPPDDTMGDLALPCFKLSRTLRRAPVQIAAALAECLSDIPCVEKAEAVNGYLNITVSKEYLVSTVLSGILSAGEAYGSSEVGKGKTVVLDYSSPNVAKPFHIGHLGTTVIGHALKKLHEFAGYKCVGTKTGYDNVVTFYRSLVPELKLPPADAAHDLYLGRFPMRRIDLARILFSIQNEGRGCEFYAINKMWSRARQPLYQHAHNVAPEWILRQCAKTAASLSPFVLKKIVRISRYGFRRYGMRSR